MIKGILLDKDGTIIDFFKVWIPAVRPVLKRILSENQLSFSEQTLIELEERLGIVKGIIDPESSFAWKPFDKIAEDLNQAIEDIYQERIDGDTLETKLVRYFTKETQGYYPVFTDMVELLGKLKRKGIEVGVVTTDTLESTLECLRTLEIIDKISFLATSDNGFPVKPDRRIIDIVAEQWQCLPQEIMMIGDSPNDMIFALNGNAIPVGVLSGVSLKEDLKRYTPNVLSSLSELEDFLVHKRW
ncbi:HAD family hydrolase [Streptococcus merionis]|uniref:HAD family hydrolase n=1 Tax=Streptococcus merionis TaxID=400065 RepID=UPI0026EE35A3|nr:HAD family hydrolase [Streptococcus merionis]